MAYTWKIIGWAQIPKKNCWVLAAAQQNLPLYVPGWEDSTLGNLFVAAAIRKDVSLDSMKSGLHYMKALTQSYQQASADHPLILWPIPMKKSRGEN